MSLWEGVLLGLLQGLTEFLPVSSSGHLVMGKTILGIHTPGATFEIFVHAGTLLAIHVHFRRDLLNMVGSVLHARWDEHGRRAAWVLLGTVPAALMVFLYGDSLEALFDNVPFVAIALAFTGVMLLLCRVLPLRSQPVGPGRAFIIGGSQALALLPGISRSGATFFAARGLGVSREEAARFSFLLAVPALYGAVILRTMELARNGEPDPNLLPYLVGALTAFLSGWLALRCLLFLIRRGKLAWFGIYCLAAALAAMLLTA